MLWSNTYRRPVSDILNVQREIAGAIAGTIEATLTDKEREDLGTTREIDPAAYRATLIGWNLVNKVDETNLREAIKKFQRAIDIDPTYAEGYVGLAQAHLLNTVFGWASFQDAEPLIRRAVNEALNLDDRHSRAHTVRGALAMMHDWDWEAAERDLDQALAINPNNAEAHLWFSPLYTILGRPEAGVEAARLSVELDPLNGYHHLNYGWTLVYTHRFEEAREVLQATKSLHPGIAAWAHNHLGLLAMAEGNFDQACVECDEAFALLEGAAEHVIWACCGRAFALNGRTEEARDLLDRMVTQAEQRYVDPMSLALLYEGLGDIDQTIAMIRKAQDEKSPQVFMMSLESWSDALLDDPRFAELMERMNYPEL
jgi:serine/threonine-protein kinase